MNGIYSLENSVNLSTFEYRKIDSLESFYDFKSNKEVINSFLCELNEYTDTFMNLLFDISTKIKSLIVDVKLSLKIIEGDYFHNNLLGISVKLSNFEDSYIFDNFEASLYDLYDEDDLDLIHLSLEF